MRRPFVTVSLFVTAVALSPALPLVAQLPRLEPTSPRNRVLTHREEAPVIRVRIAERFETVLPELMRREGIDMWVIVSREYNDDPVFRSMAPAETYSSRRRTVLVFHDRGGDSGVGRCASWFGAGQDHPGRL